MADKLFRDYFNEKTATTDFSGNVLTQIGTGEPNKLNIATPQYNTVTDLGNVSGNVTINWDTAIKYKMRLIGNTTLIFSNFAAYEGIKVQELEIYSDSNAHTLTFPSGVDLDDISSTPIDFALTTTGNHLSFRVLNSTPYFQTANYVKQV